MAARPHMLILMTDQQRADCLHCAGHPQLQTPNLDRLAREGTRFAQATTVAPLCMPARVSFATALYPSERRAYMLYDVESDPQEQDNLAGDPAARGLENELRRQLRERLEHSRYVP